MTRKNLIDAIAASVGIKRAEADDIFNVVLQTIKETLSTGEEVKISNFGTFMVRQKRSRVGRNPKTKEEVLILPRRVVTFKASDQLRKTIEQGEERRE